MRNNSDCYSTTVNMKSGQLCWHCGTNQIAHEEDVTSLQKHNSELWNLQCGCATWQIFYEINAELTHVGGGGAHLQSLYCLRSTTDNREVFEEGNKGVKLKRLTHRKQ
jgi:hypothetical protein